jgi:hypothetical protein
MNYIDKGWQGYKALLPKDASDVQIRETRQAFFGGAAVLFEALMTAILDPGEEPTEEDMKKMSDIQRELSEFGRNLDSRYLGTKRQN